MSKYLDHDKLLVYLDQCAVSRLAPKESNVDFRRFRDAIFAAHSSGRILCPSSLEHLVETSAMLDEHAIEVDDVLRKLSSGWSLTPEPRLIARQIFCLVCEVRMSRKHFLQRDIYHPLSRHGALLKLRELKVEMDAHNDCLMQSYNEFNALIRDGSMPNNSMLPFFIERHSATFTKALQSSIENALLSGRAEILPDFHQNKCADWASQIVYLLVKENHFRSTNLKRLHKELVRNGITRIPMLRVKAELKAHQTFTREKIEARDQYDITRLACSLPYADIIVTDGGKAEAIRRLGLDVAFNTEVFSMKRAELPALIERLMQLATL